MPKVIAHIGGLITPLATAHEPPNRYADYAADYVLAASASGPVPRAGHKLK